MHLITYRDAAGTEVLPVIAGGLALAAATLVRGGPPAMDELADGGTVTVAAEGIGETANTWRTFPTKEA